MADGSYPIAMTYLNCVQAMCQINLKEQEEAIQSVDCAWQRAKLDGFMEPLLNIMDYFKEFWKYVFEKRNLMFIKTHGWSNRF